MSSEITILDAATQALRAFGRPASIDEIFEWITAKGLYQFNTPTPEHVLRTTIRRHTGNVERVDSSERVVFEMIGDEHYQLQVTGRMNKKSSSAGLKRIQRASDKEEFIRSMVSDQVGVFKEMWKLLLFAAQVGIANGRRETLKSIDAGKGIDQSTFGNCPAWPGVLFLIALAETGRSDSLSGTSEVEDERINTFQEYANGGLAIMKEFFSDRPIDLDGLLTFIDAQNARGSTAPDLNLAI